MSKEQIIDEAYKYYILKEGSKIGEYGVRPILLTIEEFINKYKTDTEFSERWGLKIEERELSAKERWDWYRKNGGPSGEQKLVALMVYEDEEDNSHIHSWLKTWAPNVPTKLITITYNDKTIESYE
jgi:hypothetical protein